MPKQFHYTELTLKFCRLEELRNLRKEVKAGKRHFAHDGELSYLFEEQKLEKELEKYLPNFGAWFRLISRAENFREKTGYGLANVWGAINQADLDEALKLFREQVALNQKYGK